MLDWIPDDHFISAVTRSLVVMFSVVAISTGVGLPFGTLAGLYEFRGKRLLLGILAIPLLMPSFLWAIGLSQFQILLNISEFTHTTGAFGSIFVFSSLVIPLTIYAAMLGVKSLSSNQIDAFVVPILNFLPAPEAAHDDVIVDRNPAVDHRRPVDRLDEVLQLRFQPLDPVQFKPHQPRPHPLLRPLPHYSIVGDHHPFQIVFTAVVNECAQYIAVPHPIVREDIRPELIFQVLDLRICEPCKPSEQVRLIVEDLVVISIYGLEMVREILSFQFPIEDILQLRNNAQ